MYKNIGPIYIQFIDSGIPHFKFTEIYNLKLQISEMQQYRTSHNDPQPFHSIICFMPHQKIQKKKKKGFY